MNAEQVERLTWCARRGKIAAWNWWRLRHLDVPIDLAEAPLDGLQLRHVVLVGANVRGASLQRAVLVGADLREADLRWANLTDACLEEADLGGADLREACLWGSCLTSWQLGQARSAEGAMLPERHR
jgi:uncharacterized protein YjbI with pentapeptide repeats